MERRLLDVVQMYLLEDLKRRAERPQAPPVRTAQVRR